MIDTESAKIIIRDLRKADKLQLDETLEYLAEISKKSKTAYEILQLSLAHLQTLRQDLIEREELMHEVHTILNDGVDPDE